MNRPYNRPVPTPPTTAETYRTMARLRRFFESVRRTITTEPANGGLTSQQQFALLSIAATGRGRCTIGDLARQTDAAMNTTSALVHRMERAGLVHTWRNAEDRRLVYVQLTPLGQRRLRSSTLAVVKTLRAAASKQGRAELRDAFESWFDNWSTVIRALSSNGRQRRPAARRSRDRRR